MNINKLTKLLLRIWISASSVAAFAIGWSALAHAPKPAALDVQSSSVASSIDIPDLNPVPSLEALMRNSSRTSQSQQSFSIGLPRLRTRGS